MVLIAMCVFSTDVNKKDKCLRLTLDSLRKTVKLKDHRLFLSVNGKTDQTLDIIKKTLQDDPYTVIENETNLGTAKGINKCWKLRNEGEHCIKMDDDVVIHQIGWLDILVEALSRDSSIGQIALKRKDLLQTPGGEWPSTLTRLHHKPGEKWIDVEFTDDIMGTCVLHSDALINKTGGLFQGDGNLYGFDDTFKSLVSKLAGFKNCFYPYVDIDHIDNDYTDYTEWKQKLAAKYSNQYLIYRREFESGHRSLYISMD
jgi:GT2 family glycosyltransferase